MKLHGGPKRLCNRYQKINCHILWTTVYIFHVHMTNKLFTLSTGHQPACKQPNVRQYASTPTMHNERINMTFAKRSEY